MSSLFNFTKGEWSISLFLLLIFLLSLFYNHFYSYSPKETFDITEFQQDISSFKLYQCHINDSVAAEKERRSKRYGNHNFDKKENSSSRFYPQSYDSIPPRKATSPQKSYAIVKVELNSCDTSDIMRIPLFGSKRAAKLIEYRDALGGFHSLAQLHEIYILQSIDIQHFERYFTVDSMSVKMIDINRAEYNELIQHPYFDAYLTKSVLYYREKKGKITNMTEFQQATNAYQELLFKLHPYLDFGN